MPTTPFVLSLIAGVLFLLGALVPLVFVGSFSGMDGMMEGYDGLGMMDTGSIAARIVDLVFAGVVLYAAIMLNSKPTLHVT
jgi:hypothetical protein